MLKEIFNDGVYALFNKICYFGAKTLAIILITGSLGTEKGGQFIFLIGVVEILRVTCDFGVDIFVIKKYGEVTNKEQLLITVFYQKIGTGLLFSSLMAGCCYAMMYNIEFFTPISMALIFSLLFNLSNSYFQSLNENKQLTPFIIVASIIVISFFCILYLNGVEYKPYGYLLVESVFFLSVFFALFRKIGFHIAKGLREFEFRSVIKLYKNTYSIGITAFLVIIYSRLDNIYLNIYDPQNLAVYGQMFRLVDPLVMVSSVFSTVAYAKFSRFDLRKKEVNVRPFIIMMAAYVVVSSIGYYIMLNTLGKMFILPTVYFQYFALGFLCIAGIKCLNGALTALLQSQGLYKIGMCISLVCICLAIPIMYIFIRYHQALGAIYSIITIELVSFILLSISVFMFSNRIIFNK